MSKTNFVSNHDENKQDIYVSKWSTMAAKDKQARQEQDKNWFRQRKPNGNENEWGPMFKNKAHFSDMHLC